MNPPLASTLAILGPGLLGGSLAGAARKENLASEIRVWARRMATADQVVARGWADAASDDIAAVVDGADLIVLATPVGAMPGLARQIVAVRDRLADDVLITDVGSVKKFVADQVAPIFDAAGLTFIGSHPMAGAETAGFEAARDDLFQGAACFVMSAENADEQHRSDVLRIVRFWERLGCRRPVSAIVPALHDLTVARISHLPHLAASALITASLSGAEQDAFMAGGGLRDTTRVASGNPEMWTEIVWENKEGVERALDGLQAQLHLLLGHIRNGDKNRLHHFLSEAKRLRDQSFPPR